MAQVAIFVANPILVLTSICFAFKNNPAWREKLSNKNLLKFMIVYLLVAGFGYVLIVYLEGALTYFTVGSMLPVLVILLFLFWWTGKGRSKF